jgi:hypothetical protein
LRRYGARCASQAGKALPLNTSIERRTERLAGRIFAAALRAWNLERNP